MFSRIRSLWNQFHQRMMESTNEQGYTQYAQFLFFWLDRLENGFLIWLVLFIFPVPQHVLLIPCYGLLWYWFTKIIQEIKQ